MDPHAQPPADLPRPEAEGLLWMIGGFIASRLVYAAAKLGVADHLASGPRPAGDLAALTGTDPSALYRVLRALAGMGVLMEGEDGRFALTPAGELLRGDVPGSLRPFAIFYGEPWHQRPWEEILHSLRTGRPAFDHVHGMPAFDYMARHPEVARQTDEAMTGLTALYAPHLVGACSLAGHRRLMDVGGGNGVLLAAALERNEGLRGILVDLPHAIENARRAGFLAADGVRDRAEMVEGSFFDPLPRGSDAFLLKDILHDWSDGEARRILSNCRDALPPKGRLFVIERLVPPANEPSPAKLLDIEMLVMLTGRERSEAEFRALFEASGLRLLGARATPTQWAVLEAEPA